MGIALKGRVRTVGGFGLDLLLELGGREFNGAYDDVHRASGKKPPRL